MNKITQTMLFRQSLIKYALKHSVIKAAIRYNTNRQYVYRWMRRYDGSLQSLANKSRRPHNHPNQHSKQELKLISDMRKRNPSTGLVVFWVKLLRRGYKRSITGLYRILRRIGQLTVKLPNPKYIPKPYEQMTYPGQRVQVDVKHVPLSCITSKINGERYYQYTAIDEFSRFRYVEGFKEYNTYSSAIFIRNMIAFFKRKGFTPECVQTDNGTEFTRRFSNDKPTLFEEELAKNQIRHKRIRPYTPRHNGKVERSHRKDNEYFYAVKKFYSLEDFKSQLNAHNRKYNNFPMRPLGWKAPAQVLKAFIKNM